MIGIYLLFFISFLFLGENISRLRFRKDLPKDSSANRAKYIFATIATIFCALPIVFVLWDYYSLAKLFYSLFGGISVFSALLMLRFVANCVLSDFGKSAQRFVGFTKFASFTQRFAKFPRFAPESQSIISPNPTNPRAFLIILIFAIALFLGHLDLIAIDIFSGGRAIVALFVGAFIIALYFADKITGILALGAFIVAIFSSDLLSDSTQRAIFALFDGYLLIYSFVFSVIWGVRKILGKDSPKHTANL